MAVILPELLARTMPASSPVVYECMDGGAGSGTTPPPALIPARHQHTWRLYINSCRPGGGETKCPRRWQFDGGISFCRQSGHQYLHVDIRVSPVRKFSRNKDLRQSMDLQIEVDLRPPTDGSAVHTSGGRWWLSCR